MIGACTKLAMEYAAPLTRGHVENSDASDVMSYTAGNMCTNNYGCEQTCGHQGPTGCGPRVTKNLTTIVHHMDQHRHVVEIRVAWLSSEMKEMTSLLTGVPWLRQFGGQ